ncbi:MAG: prepilin-type N-terminal cleavage/methylation protein [Frankiales bacterium]|nr:prepilin-type N-terminal cleavage/methylation protein [Frankiales bacterium]
MFIVERTDSAGLDQLDDGFSLVEVMLAMTVFVIGSLALLASFASSLSGSFDNRARVTAANLAASDLDDARSQDYYALSGAAYTRTVDGRSYTVSRAVAASLASGADTSACVSSGSAKQLYKRVTTSVTTAFRGPVKPVRADTLVKAPVFDPTAARGAISFKVIDREGQPVPAAPVSTNGRSATTDANGCVFFDGLPAADYTVSVDLVGYVLAPPKTTTTTTVGVNAGQITTQSAMVGRKATITTTANVYQGTSTVSGYNPPVPLNLSLVTPDQATTSRVDLPTTPISVGSSVVSDVFPSRGGYDAFLGTCSTPVHTTSEPGPNPPTVALRLVPVKITRGGQNPGGRTVTADWAGGSCSETLSFGVTTSSTGVIQLAVPPGRWTFRSGSTRAVGPVDVVAGVPLVLSL